ncbi:MAG: hypothetical protein R2690_09980 [Acidimicrobiales bacterium]
MLIDTTPAQAHVVLEAMHDIARFPDRQLSVTDADMLRGAASLLFPDDDPAELDLDTLPRATPAQIAGGIVDQRERSQAMTFLVLAAFGGADFDRALRTGGGVRQGARCPARSCTSCASWRTSTCAWPSST